MSDPTPAELEMIADATHGSPLKRSPAQGITDMQARIQLLLESKRKVLDHMADGKDNLDARLSEINRDLAEANARLAEYQAQQRGLN